MNDENTIQLAINTIRTLSIDAVQQAKSGHPALRPDGIARAFHLLARRPGRRRGRPDQGIQSRVVSMTLWEIFEEQSREYQESVLPPYVEARVAGEQASTFGWERYVGTKGQVVGMHTFGASAPLKSSTEARLRTGPNSGRRESTAVKA